MMEVTCSPPMVPKWINATAREKAKQLDEVVLAALLFASNAASPAFNIDDHYRLAGAISAALEAAPEVLSADTLGILDWFNRDPGQNLAPGAAAVGGSVARDGIPKGQP